MFAIPTRLQSSPNPLKLAALVGLILMTAVAAGALWIGADAGPGKKPADILAEAETASDQVAATVNGVDITRARVIQARMLAEYLGGPAASALATDEAVIEMMVRQELLYQEAIRRGLTADPAAVRTEIARAQQRMLPQVAGVAADPKLKELNDALADTGFAVEGYDSSPQVYAAFERTLLISALTDQLVADVPASDRTPDLTQQRTEDLYRELRATADVQVFTTAP